MNIIYISKFHYAPMITSQIQYETFASTDEGSSPKLAQSHGRSRENKES